MFTGAGEVAGSSPASVTISTKEGRLSSNSKAVGRGHMHEHSDYLREQATKYRELAAKADDAVAKQEFCELAKVCEEVANDMDDRRVSG